MNEPNWSRLARYLSGECTDGERKDIEAQIAADPEFARMVATMQPVWNASESSQASDIEGLWLKVATQAGLAKDAAQTKARPRQLPRQTFADNYYRILRVAASIVAVLALGYWLNQAGVFSTAPDMTTLVVENGERQEITLDDGTRIVLDSGSILTYPNKFEGDLREVKLSGEGFFAVAPNPEKPFVVHVQHGVVRVLGTKFNVRAWGPEAKVEVAVSEGKVALSAALGESPSSVTLTQNQFSSLVAGGVPSAPEQVDVAKYLAWMQNEAFFEDASLQEIFFQLERWYKVQFVVEDKTLLTDRLNLHLKEDSIDAVLKLLTALTDAQYYRSGQVVRVSGRD